MPPNEDDGPYSLNAALNEVEKVKLASILHAGLVGSGVAGAGWLWGVIAPGGHDCWAGVARWAGVPGPVGFLGSGGWWVCWLGEGCSESLPCLGYRVGPAPGGVDA
jgi:hypothetical protein